MQYLKIRFHHPEHGYTKEITIDYTTYNLSKIPGDLANLFGDEDHHKILQGDSFIGEPDLSPIFDSYEAADDFVFYREEPIYHRGYVIIKTRDRSFNVFFNGVFAGTEYKYMDAINRIHNEIEYSTYMEDDYKFRQEELRAASYDAEMREDVFRSLNPYR